MGLLRMVPENLEPFLRLIVRLALQGMAAERLDRSRLTQLVSKRSSLLKNGQERPSISTREDPVKYSDKRLA